MATIILTPADDIVTEINALIAGDKAILTPGDYVFAGNILKSGVEVSSEYGVTLSCTGNMLTGIVSEALFTGYAEIITGTVNFTASYTLFRTGISRQPLTINGTTGTIFIETAEGIVTTVGEASLQIMNLKAALNHNPGADDLVSTLKVYNLAAGGSINVVTFKTFLNLRINYISGVIGNAVNLSKCAGTVTIGNVVAGNKVVVDLTSDLLFDLSNIPPEIKKTDSASKVFIKGNVNSTLVLDGDATLFNFTSNSIDFCIDAAAAVTAFIDKGVLLSSQTDPASANVTLDVVDNTSSTLHNDLTGRSASDAHPISSITSLQTTLDAKALDLDLNNHIGDANVHLSVNERAAIDNTPTPPTALNPFATAADIAAAGGGDMLKSVYDQTDNGIVDNSEKLGNQLPAFYDQNAHVADMANPHNVTKAQVGLGNVDNTSDLAKPVSVAQASAIAAKEDAFAKNTAFNKDFGLTVGTVAEGNHNHSGVYEPAFSKNTAFNKNFGTAAGTVAEGNHLHTGVYEPAFTKNTAFNKNFGTAAGTVATGNHLHTGVYEPANSNIQLHIASTNNPHGVNKSQVGLGNVDNTSDVNKPVSTAQQAEIDTKEDDLGNPTVNGMALVSTTLGVRSWSSLGTGTVTNITVGVGLDITNPSTIPNITLDLNELPTGGTLVGTDDIVSVNGSASTKQQISNIPLSIFNDNLGYTTDHTLLSNIGSNSHAQIDSHISNTNNPHLVNKTDVGLGNADNTSDLAKPISTATQAALNALYLETNSKFLLRTSNFQPAPGENYVIGGTLQMLMDSGVADGTYWDIFIQAGTLTFDWDDPAPSPLPTLIVGHMYRIVRNPASGSIWTMVDLTATSGGGVTVHNDLTGRSVADAHPQSAITGLVAALAAKEAALGNPASNGMSLQSTIAGVRSWGFPSIAPKPYTHITMATQQEMAGVAGTEHLVIWNGTPIHTDGEYTLSGSRITVKTGGRYYFYWEVGITQAGVARTTYMSGHKINGGATIVRGRRRNYSRGAIYGDASIGLTTEVVLAANDYIEAVVAVDDTDATYSCPSIPTESECIMRLIE